LDLVAATDGEGESEAAVSLTCLDLEIRRRVVGERVEGVGTVSMA
jgi:hypothetical protein